MYFKYGDRLTRSTSELRETRRGRAVVSVQVHSVVQAYVGSARLSSTALCIDSLILSVHSTAQTSHPTSQTCASPHDRYLSTYIYYVYTHAPYYIHTLHAVRACLGLESIHIPFTKFHVFHFLGITTNHNVIVHPF